MNLRLIHDPGHGWLEVPAELLAQLDIAHEISGYSYVCGGLVYLEEDLDMHRFLKAAARINMEVKVQEQFQDPTPIRNYNRYGAYA